jgi:hypothetical protein
VVLNVDDGNFRNDGGALITAARPLSAGARVSGRMMTTGSARTRLFAGLFELDYCVCCRYRTRPRDSHVAGAQRRDRITSALQTMLPCVSGLYSCYQQQDLAAAYLADDIRQVNVGSSGLGSANAVVCTFVLTTSPRPREISVRGRAFVAATSTAS